MSDDLVETRDPLDRAELNWIPDRLEAAQHAGQPATVWVRSYLLSVCGLLALVVFVGLYAWWLRRAPVGERVPNYSFLADHRLDKRVTALSVVTDREGRGTGLVAADAESVHCGKTVKNLFTWRHTRLRDLQAQLPAAKIVGLSGYDDRAVFVCEPDDGGRRGLTAGLLPNAWRGVSLWPRSLLDVSCFPGLEDGTAHCLLRHPQTGWWLVGAAGLGIYDPQTRHWLPPLGGLRCDVVYDLDLLPNGDVAVLGHGGIDCGSLAPPDPEGLVAWDRHAHYDRSSGLVGNDVRHGRVQDGELLYVTAPGGLGRVPLAAGGGAPAAQGLVGEGAAPGLSRASLLRAAEDGPRQAVWMAHQLADPADHVSVAQYRTAGHQMLSLPVDQAWPSSPTLTLAADEHQDPPAAWVGGRGLRQVQSGSTAGPGDPGLAVVAKALEDRDVEEIALHPQAVFVHARGEAGRPGTSPHTVEAATRRQIAAGDATAWSAPYIGPRRFPDLTQPDVTAVCDGHFENQSVLYLATQGKGLAAFLRGTRELRQLHHTQADDLAFRIPYDGSLDIAAGGSDLVQVGSGRTLAYHNGQRWVRLIAEQGTQLKPADVNTVVADSETLVLGTPQKIACYDVSKHKWSDEIPPLPGLERLALGIGRLWALNTKRQLFSIPLRPPGRTWTEEDHDVFDFYGDPEIVAVVAGNQRLRRLWVQPKGAAKPRPLVSLAALPGRPPTGERWTAAAAKDKALYVTPHRGQIGRYDLQTRRWELLPLPPDTPGTPRRLLVTNGRLWLLAGNDVLYSCEVPVPPDAKPQWVNAAEQVERLGTDGTEVIVLTRSGNVQLTTKGQPPMLTLVGDAFAEDLTNVIAATVHHGQLFVGTPEHVGRYEVERHAWQTFADVQGAVQFADTANHLYARTGAGRVIRWVSATPGWEPVGFGAGDAKAVRLAAAGGPALFALFDDGTVRTVLDKQPGVPATLIAASRMGPGALTVGTEIDRALVLGLDSGRVAAYDKVPNQPWAWTTLLDGGREIGAIRQLLVPAPNAGQVVAVGSNKVVLCHAQAGKWNATDLLNRPEIFGAVGGGAFYGLEQPDAAEQPDGRRPQLYRVDLAAPAPPVTYLGAPFPKSPNPATAGVGVSANQELFRADASGVVAQYEITENGWKDTQLRNVHEFLQSGQGLWAWALNDKTLYRWAAPDWKAADKDVEHVVSDGQDLLLARSTGELVLRAGGGDTTLVPALPAKPLPIAKVADITAAAELKEWLFLGAKQQPVLAYQRAQHQWRVEQNLSGVVDFCRLTPAGAPSALFSLNETGEVHRCDDALAKWGRVDVPGKATKLVANDKHLVILAEDGVLHLATADGKIAGSYQTHMLAKRQAADLRFRAAHEANGKFLVVPELAAEAAELWRYDPASHTWLAEPVKGIGQPQRFLDAGGLWLVLENPNGGVNLAVINDAPPVLGNTAPGLVDVASDGNAIWAINQDHRVCNVNRAAVVAPAGIPEVELPKGANVQQAFGVADQCAVLLDDGSVHHYGKSARQWEQRIAPVAGTGPKGQLYYDPQQRRWLLVRSQKELWACDGKTGKWVQAAPGTAGMPEIPTGPHPAEVPEPAWTITPEPVLKFQVDLDGDGKPDTSGLTGGRFEWDLPEQVAADDNTVWLKLKGPGGTRECRRGVDADGKAVWKVTMKKAADFPAKPTEFVAFAGQRFQCSRDPQGAFPTTAAAGPVTVKMQLAGNWVTLKAGQNAAGAGFAHDVVRDVAAFGGDLWLATAGGAARLAGLPAMQLAQLDGPPQGLSDDDLAADLVDSGTLLARTQAGAFARLDATTGKWSTAAADPAGAFARAARIERCNGWLDNWSLAEPAADQRELRIRIGNNAIPVTLTPDGFGFDQPRALALDTRQLRLWTQDGRVDWNRTAVPGPVAALDPQQKLPGTVSGFADHIDDGGQLWFRDHATPNANAQVFRNGIWEAKTADEFEAVLVRVRPLWLAVPQLLQWSRQDEVTFQFPALNGGQAFTTGFDPARGCFLLNIPYGIAVSNGDLWAVTAGGIVRFDRQKRWEHVTPRNFAPEDKARIVHLAKLNILIVALGDKYVEWNGKAWAAPTMPGAVRDALQRLDQFLVDGNTWQVKRDEVRQEPRRLSAALIPGGPLHEVLLDSEGLFNFERVHDLADDGPACISATDFGLTRVDSGTADFSHFWPQELAKTLPPRIVGRWKGTLYARLARGGALEYDATKAQWQPAAAPTVFDEIEKTLVGTPPWTWLTDGNTHRVQCLQGPGGLWQKATPLDVKLSGKRFDFDTVSDVGQSTEPWLNAAAGLVARGGAGFVEITNILAGKWSLLGVTQDDLPELFAEDKDKPVALGRLQHGTRANVAAAEAAEVRQLAQRQEARSRCFDIARSPAGADWALGLHLPNDPARLYKPIEFDPTLGSFTFDEFGPYPESRGWGKITRQAGEELAILVNTGGGVARYLAGEAAGEAFCRLYVDEKQDGIGRVAVERLLLGKRRPANLLAARDPLGRPLQYYRLEDGRWQAGAHQQQYEQERRTIVFEPNGWQVEDLAAAEVKPSAAEFAIRWRGQTVRLVALQETQDGAEGLTRFAHDVPLSAAVVAGQVWLGTRGGVVRFPVQRPGTIGSSIDLKDFDLHADNVLPAEDLRGATPPQGVVLVRAVPGGSGLFARRGDGRVLRYDPQGAANPWNDVPPDAPEFQAACRSTADDFWSWTKDGLAACRPPAVDARRSRVPADYAWLTNGTWSFLETGHCPRRDPQRTMVFHQGFLYLATAGGVARFAEPPNATSLGPDGDRFIDAVYAVADGPAGEVPLRNVVELFRDPAQPQLYARTADGTSVRLDTAQNTWSVVPASEAPFEKPRVVVDNPLLHWSVTAAGWDLAVRPLCKDLPDQSQYPLFSHGRFAFDCVRAFAAVGQRLWLATDGGVCAYDRAAFEPQEFFAAALAPAAGVLPGVREIVADRGDATRLLCRCRRDDGTRPAFEGRGDVWQPTTDAEPFLAAYQREEDALLRFVQYPDGTLEAHLRTAAAQPPDGPPPVALGTARSGKNPLPLFARNRFAFDDVRAAVLEGDRLLAATAAGIVERQLDWEGQTATVTAIRCYPGSAAVPPALAALDNLLRLPDGSLLAWNQNTVFHGSPQASPEPCVWTVVPGLTGAGLQTRMLLPDENANWLLVRNEEHSSMRLYRLPAGQIEPPAADAGQALAARYQAADVSTAVMDEQWIYQINDGGGVVRVPKAAVR